jgi:alkylhydroperoxidase/carboxymuconolactone decarboxylase family protein YurZ
MAAAAVLDGRRLYARRADLHAVIAIADPARSQRLVDTIRARAATRKVQWQEDPDGCGRRDVETALGAAARVYAGGQPSDAELAELACGLTDVAVRDTLYALAVGADAAAAEALWGVLARRLPDPWRVEAVVLLAFSAYARGDGPLAGISLEAALRSDPDHRMAGMLDTALQSGMRPEQIRELTGTGYRLAKRLGVRLPPRRTFGRAV